MIQLTQGTMRVFISLLAFWVFTTWIYLLLSHHGSNNFNNDVTFKVRIIPWLLDILDNRTYNPTKIEGGPKTATTVILSPNTPNDSYTWVYTTNDTIMYRRWNKTDEEQGNYVRHSQLGSGEAVRCAGELWITTVWKNGVRSSVTKINDASGHYWPNGRICLPKVLGKLRALGVPMGEKDQGLVWLPSEDGCRMSCMSMRDYVRERKRRKQEQQEREWRYANESANRD
ncbi:hypothetical protein CONLIGDRAFT_672341 [Coniochaeta ligniaria NRRL 30616]|uniref:Uncharacterized protein n=1 Tax=Coniochaeta ligniaria NRRL 30616 TaxID=1408157 RepID=A0A1J7IHC5_9PEZI|nr:hypothetical protein CONLIGDRAFT_672341 [Coniochaeta ligniaria NRRL 30616]